MHTYLIVAFFCLFSVGCFWMIFNQPRQSYILKVTCNGVVVIQKEFLELEDMCELVSNGVLKWQFYPAASDEKNVVTIEVVRV